MINTTNNGHSAPSLFSAANSAVQDDRSDHVSILSDLARGNAEPQSVSAGFRVRWPWWLIAATLGGGIAFFGMMLTPSGSVQRGAMPASPASHPTPALPTPSIAQTRPSNDDLVDSTPAAAVIRDNSGAGASAANAPIAVSQKGAAEAAARVVSADIATPAEARKVTMRPVTAASSAKQASRRTHRGRPAEHAEQRTPDADVDIITAIVKHAESAATR